MVWAQIAPHNLCVNRQYVFQISSVSTFSMSEGFSASRAILRSDNSRQPARDADSGSQTSDNLHSGMGPALPLLVSG